MQFIRHRFPKQKIGLFVRGEMGSSRKYLHMMDCIITNSKGISEYVKGLLNGFQIPIQIIPNTLDNTFCKTPKDYSTFQNQVIYTGRIEKVKGVFELLKAFKIVQEQIPEAKLKIIGGDFSKRKLNDYEQLLINYVMQNQLNVMFIGEMPNKQLPGHLLEADLAVYPSICLESFGMVALEAMRCGLPVIASRRPGFEELIENGQTGIIIDDPEDIEVLARIIIKLLRQPSELKRMGENGYTRSLQYLPEMSNSSFRNFIFHCLNLNVTN
jgi:glycosyltransferase involved in cell wall biosynthesis